ncbi:MAG: STAS/SEC14 domain-containing protein [Bacillus sp. (in: firmicutes)]
MLKILPSVVDTVIAVEFSGKMTEEDAQVLDRYIAERFGEEKPFHLLAIVNDLDGTSLMGMVKGLKFDFKRMGQMNKIAVVSEKNWIKNLTDVGDYMPNLEMKHFLPVEIDDAWQWLKTNDMEQNQRQL